MVKNYALVIHNEKPRRPSGLREALGWRSVSRFFWKLGTIYHRCCPPPLSNDQRIWVFRDRFNKFAASFLKSLAGIILENGYRGQTPALREEYAAGVQNCEPTDRIVL